MAKIVLKLDAKYIKRHAAVAYLHCSDPVEFRRGDSAMVRLGGDTSVPDVQFATLEALVLNGLTIEIDRAGKCRVIMKT